VWFSDDCFRLALSASVCSFLALTLLAKVLKREGCKWTRWQLLLTLMTSCGVALRTVGSSCLHFEAMLSAALLYSPQIPVAGPLNGTGDAKAADEANAELLEVSLPFVPTAAKIPSCLMYFFRCCQPAAHQRSDDTRSPHLRTAPYASRCVS
jgi:hypothetical protein